MFHNKTSNQQQKQHHYYSGPAQGKGLGEQAPPPPRPPTLFEKYVKLSTVGPRRDWQNMFVITRCFYTYIDVLSHIALNFTITGVKKNSSLDRGLRYRGSTVLYIFI